MWAGRQAAAVYEMPNPQSMRMATVQPGALIVVFDDPGVMRQVNTAEQTFGYLARGVKLQAVDNVVPAEVYDPRLRAAAEARLAARPAPAPRGGALTGNQLGIAIGFGAGVFAIVFVLLWLFG